MWRRMIKEMRSHPGNRLIAVLILAFLLPAVAFAQQFDAAGEQQLLELINKDRAEAGVPPLALDERLTQAARRHTQLMVQHNELTHQFAGEPSLQVRVANEGLRSDRQAENVGLEMDVPRAHAMLMNSPPHRANILNADYNAVGIGVIQVGDQFYVTEDFAHRLADYSDADADAALQKAITDYAAAHRIPAPVRKAQPELHDMACHMAVIDALDTRTPRSIPGVHKVMAWTATEVEQLPTGVKALAGQPLPNGYSLGVCFAGNPTHPGGIYWIVMVAY
jgi:uncharacterized protein YkwD